MGREERVRRAVEERRALVDDAIAEELPIQRPERLYEASRYLLDAGGKRLRPAILLLAGEALADVEPLSRSYRDFPALDADGAGQGDGGTVDLMAAGVSIEIVHLFTLIHDDIMDDDDLRRGVESVHRAYDTETAILAGDTLYSTAFEIMLATGAPPDRSVRTMRCLASTCTEICEGQGFDLEFETRADVTLEEYHEMIELKTAVLYGAAASIPGILLGADDGTVDALYRYGIEVGRAFQIHDDVLDLTVPSDRLGKERGSDLVAGKRTLITVHAREHGVDVDALLASAAGREDTVEAAVAEFENAGSLEYARRTARDLVQSGKSRLDALPENGARARLRDIADFLIEREY